MERALFVLCIVILLTITSSGQGLFVFSNGSIADPIAFTRVGSIVGPFADSEFYAQMLAGNTVDNLVPVGVSLPHLTGEFAGQVYGGSVPVPGSSPFTYVFVQMVAWDSRLWGTALAGVPSEWLGRTDIVSVFLGPGEPPGPPPGAPHFTQPAIIPVPEPSALALAGLSGAVLFLWRVRHRR